MLASSLIYFYSDVRCCRDEIFYSNSAPCRAASNLLQWPHGAKPQIRILRIQLQTVSPDFPTRGNTWGRWDHHYQPGDQRIRSLQSVFLLFRNINPDLPITAESQARPGLARNITELHFCVKIKPSTAQSITNERTELEISFKSRC